MVVFQCMCDASLDMKMLEQLLCPKLNMTGSTTVPQEECMSTPAQNTSHGWQSAFLDQWPLLLPLLLTEGRDGLSGDVTVRSKAVGLPQSQLEARMSAGRVCWSSRPSPLPASALALMQA